ncbi:MAG: hypothetical protein CHACPFDD_02514 [Phycisphaerae bacterium]|nr:hypothetical protein [Phycisphaerae bacterium]
MTEKNRNYTTTTTTAQCCQTFPWEQISTPGTYICNWSGHLLRVPADGVVGGFCPLFNIVGNEPLYVTKISEDPYLNISQARIAASNLDLTVNF